MSLIIAVAIAAITYTTTAALTDVPFTVKGLVTNMAIAAFSAAVTCGIGDIAKDGFTNFWSKATFKTLAHGTFQGGMTAIQGGKFWSGFASGAVSSIAATAMISLGSSGEYSSGNYNVDGSCEVRNFGMDHNGLMTAGTLVAGAITGGAAAALSKGYFWQGAVTGLFVAGFNHLGHYVAGFSSNRLTDKELKKIYDAYPKGNENDPNYISRDELFKLIGEPLEDWYNEDTSNPNLQNTCALRLSKALNDAGFKIPSSSATYKGAEGKNYFLTVKNITTYLSKSNVFGTPTLLQGTMKNGIITQSNCGWSDATGHVDIIYRGNPGSHYYNECSTTSYWH